MSVIRSIARGAGVRSLVDRTSLTFDGDYIFDNNALGLALQQTLVGNREQIAPDYLAFVQQAYKQSPIIYACLASRLDLFRQARFAFRDAAPDGGRPGPYYRTDALAPLERPWTNGTLEQLLSVAELHNSLAGNFFAARRGDQVKVMQPHWTMLLLGSNADENTGPLDLDAEVVGYVYFQGGHFSESRALILPPHEVCHWAPSPDPDPQAPFRGMSWITPVIEELLADKAMTSHRKKFMNAGATPNLAVKLNVTDVKEFRKWVDEYRAEREGAGVDINPYRTLFLASVADPIPIGTDLKQIDFAAVQQAGEVRIAAAAGVHPAIVPFTAGLQGSTLNKGNLETAFRQFANGKIRPLWGSMAGALSAIVDVPAGAELCYDVRGLPALEDDETNKADVLVKKGTFIRTMVDGGFTPESVVAAAEVDDVTLLKHSGLPSVQLQPAPASNGNGSLATTPA